MRPESPSSSLRGGARRPRPMRQAQGWTAGRAGSRSPHSSPSAEEQEPPKAGNQEGALLADRPVPGAAPSWSPEKCLLQS